jgi:hypothetical protein
MVGFVFEERTDAKVKKRMAIEVDWMIAVAM